MIKADEPSLSSLSSEEASIRRSFFDIHRTPKSDFGSDEASLVSPVSVRDPHAMIKTRRSHRRQASLPTYAPVSRHRKAEIFAPRTSSSFRESKHPNPDQDQVTDDVLLAFVKSDDALCEYVKGLASKGEVAKQASDDRQHPKKGHHRRQVSWSFDVDASDTTDRGEACPHLVSLQGESSRGEGDTHAPRRTHRRYSSLPMEEYRAPRRYSSFPLEENKQPARRGRHRRQVSWSNEIEGADEIGPADLSFKVPHQRGLRDDYALGNSLRDSAHALKVDDEEGAAQVIDSLQNDDFAFVQRSDGSYSYSILACRSVEPVRRGSVAEQWGEDTEEYMTFVVGSDGATKKVPRRKWGSSVLPSLSRADSFQ